MAGALRGDRPPRPCKEPPRGRRAQDRHGPPRRAVTAWTRRHDLPSAVTLLQGRAVRATPCLSNRDLVDSEHLKLRKMFVEVMHPVMGTQRVVRAPPRDFVRRWYGTGAVRGCDDVTPAVHRITAVWGRDSISCSAYRYSPSTR